MWGAEGQPQEVLLFAFTVARTGHECKGTGSVLRYVTPSEKRSLIRLFYEKEADSWSTGIKLGGWWC